MEAPDNTFLLSLGSSVFDTDRNHKTADVNIPHPLGGDHMSKILEDSAWGGSGKEEKGQL